VILIVLAELVTWLWDFVDELREHFADLASFVTGDVS
jgi:hypothetical protein